MRKGKVNLRSVFMVIKWLYVLSKCLYGLSSIKCVITVSIRFDQVLEPQGCPGLCEGDLMVEINQKGLQGLNHTQVVQLLKDCPVGTEATLVIQRGAAAGAHISTLHFWNQVHQKGTEGCLKSILHFGKMKCSLENENVFTQTHVFLFFSSVEHKRRTFFNYILQYNNWGGSETF